MRSNKRLLSVLRISVTLGLFAYVFGVLVDFSDRVVLANGSEQVGWFHGFEEDGSLQFRLAGSSETFIIPAGDIATTDSGEPRVFLGLWSIVREAQLAPLLIGASLWILVPLVTLVRWQLLNRCLDIQVRHWDAFRWQFVALFYNNVLPGLTGGDVVKAVYVARATERKTAAVVTVFVDRVIGLVGLASLAAVTLLFHLDDPRFGPAFRVIYGFLVVLVVASTLFFSRRVRRMLRLRSLVDRLPFANLIRTVDEAIFRFRAHKRVLFVAWCLSIVNHILGVSINYFYCSSLGIEGISIAALLVVLPSVWMVSALPISVGGWGLSEALHANAFSRLVTTGSLDVGVRAVALSILYRLTSVFYSLVGGVFLLMGVKGEEQVESIGGP